LAKITALDFKAALQFAPIEVLGSTETGGVAWRQQNGNDSDSTAPWQLLASVNARANSEGALDIKSVHAGESWQTLGDNVEFVDEQHFYLKGRSDRIVKIEEKRLSLTELENHLLSTPWLSDVKAVVLQGVKTAGARTRVGIVAILNDAGQQQLDQLGRRFFNEALRQHLLQHIERVLLPRHWRYVAQWPVNAQGKVPQTALISLFNEDAN
jgi:acyl-coenzyme A synthetase/AMP-(fatty) acid ligase